MRPFVITLFALLCTLPCAAQKVPPTLENPATPELSLAYHDTYREYNRCLIGAGIGVGVAAAGAIVTTRAVKADSAPEGTMDEGNGMALIFGSIITCGGLLETVGCLGGRVLCKNRMEGLRCKNDFLNMSGGDIESWNSNRSSRIFDKSEKWMKVSGITTGSLAALYCIGSLTMLGEYNDTVFKVMDGVCVLTTVSAMTNIGSMIVNASAAKNLQVAPMVAAEPFTGSAVFGLGLAARFCDPS